MTDNPFKNDPEIAVLSILINNPSETLDIDGLKPHMFDGHAHKNLFQLIMDLRDSNIPPELGIIVAKATASNTINDLGGEDYLNHIVKQSFNKDAFSEYLKTLINYYKTRSLAGLASKIKINSLVPSEIDNTILKLKENLDNLNIASGGATTLAISSGLDSIYDNIVARREHAGVQGASWGAVNVDNATGGKCGGDLWYVGGRPSQGKTALICNSMLTDAASGVPSLIFEKEMTYANLVERMLSIKSGIPITDIRLGFLDQAKTDLIHDTLYEFKKYPIHIDISFSYTDINYIESTISKYKRNHGIEVVYMDYIQLFSERDEEQTAELGRISRMLKLLANKLNICIVVISQLNRQVEYRDNKRPVMSDLRQSGNLEEDADFVVGLYRDEYYNKETTAKNLMEFIVLKARNAPVGTQMLKFESETNRIGVA